MQSRSWAGEGVGFRAMRKVVLAGQGEFWGLGCRPRMARSKGELFLIFRMVVAILVAGLTDQADHQVTQCGPTEHPRCRRVPRGVPLRWPGGKPRGPALRRAGDRPG
ncbi:MAG: hypothetical protein LC776_03960 [Acidobacteria bacterium]|nr:hypothetical protein [Acidobacteriota bacterium]